MTHHLFNGKTIAMIARENGLPYSKLYFLIVTRGAPVKEAVNYLSAKMELADALSASRKGVRKCA